MILILCGKKRVGKDTVANIIEDYFKIDFDKSVHKITFSDNLKIFCANCLGINVQILDEMKNSEQLIGNIKTRDFIINTSREILKITGKDYWVKQGLSKIQKGDINIITDLRYLHEESIIKENLTEYKIIKIIRKDVEDGFYDELEVDKIGYDYIVNNDGSLEDLKEKVYEVISRINFEI